MCRSWALYSVNELPFHAVVSVRVKPNERRRIYKQFINVAKYEREYEPGRRRGVRLVPPYHYVMPTRCQWMLFFDL